VASAVREPWGWWDSTKWVRSEVRLTLLSALAPQPGSQSRKNDEGHDADPERDADIARSHFHPEEDSEELCEGNQPEEDRDDQRAGRLFISTASAGRWKAGGASSQW
jgi:hypothetical protein